MQERLFFLFVWKKCVSMIRGSICCQHRPRGGLGVFDDAQICAEATASSVLHDSEQMWSPLSRCVFPLPFFFNGAAVFCETETNGEHLESEMSSSDHNPQSIGQCTRWNIRFTEENCSDVLGETFSPMNNFQKSLAWLCYQRTSPVHDKLYRHGSAAS